MSNDAIYDVLQSKHVETTAMIEENDEIKKIKEEEAEDNVIHQKSPLTLR
jgi:hypothetical protein